MGPRDPTCLVRMGDWGGLSRAEKAHHDRPPRTYQYTGLKCPGKRHLTVKMRLFVQTFTRKTIFAAFRPFGHGAAWRAAAGHPAYEKGVPGAGGPPGPRGPAVAGSGPGAPAPRRPVPI